MMTSLEFPPFDDSRRPSTDAHGRQLAPETFVRWVMPAAWEDTEGGVHFDVRAFHEWLGWKMTPASVRETTHMFMGMLRERERVDPTDKPAAVIVRP